MFSLLFAVIGPLLMAIFGSLQLYEVLDSPKVNIPTKIAFLFILSSFTYNIYYIATLSLN